MRLGPRSRRDQAHYGARILELLPSLHFIDIIALTGSINIDVGFSSTLWYHGLAFIGEELV
jgi:hypothetical protein